MPSRNKVSFLSVLSTRTDRRPTAIACRATARIPRPIEDRVRDPGLRSARRAETARRGYPRPDVAIHATNGDRRDTLPRPASPRSRDLGGIGRDPHSRLLPAPDLRRRWRSAKRWQRVEEELAATLPTRALDVFKVTYDSERQERCVNRLFTSPLRACSLALVLLLVELLGR